MLTILLASAYLAPSLSSPLDAVSADALTDELQAFLDNVSALTGYSFSAGYHDETGLNIGVGSGPRSPSGSAAVVPGNVTAKDTLLLGSGTKAYTAAAVMRLVDRGLLSLDDPASRHLDVVLPDLCGKTFAQLFGVLAHLVTVGHLLSMRSGIADFDLPGYDHALLNDGAAVHAPLEVIEHIANFSGAEGCTTNNCTFVCVPGECTSYSSTNFVLAGFVLLAHAPEGQRDYQTFDQLAALGLSRRRFPQTAFPSYKPMSQGGLTVAGGSYAYGAAEFYSQDASLLGWTCGNAAAPASEVARFYFELLGPGHSVVSDASLARMQTFSTLDVGWAKGYIDYGYGLMVQNVKPSLGKLPPLDDIATYVGHAGDTYAFMSDNGFYPQLNVSVSVIVNEDVDSNYPSSVVTCKVIEIVAKHRGKPTDLKCHAPLPVQYICQQRYGEHVCLPVSTTMSAFHTLDACLAKCPSAAAGGDVFATS